MKLIKEENKIKFLFICIVFVIICIIVIFLWIKNDISDNNVNIYSDFNSQGIMNDVNKLEEKVSEKEVEEKEIIYIHIAGEVVNQGVYTLNSGARIVDLIDKAGGITENADLSLVNLAYKLSDGQKIYIPNVNEKNKENLQVIIENNSEYNVNRS